ncbi:hypothetical protein NBRC116495_38020 [Aurantivibrio plasticivorans]
MWKGLLCVIVLCATTQVLANTPVLGDLNHGSRKNISCPQNQRVTGIMIVYEHNAVVGDLAVRCTPITSEGKWGGGAGYTAFGYNAQNYQWRQSASCPRDTFVGSIGGVTGATLLVLPPGTPKIESIRLSCYSAKDNGKRHRWEKNIHVAAIEPGGRTSPSTLEKPLKDCANQRITRGIRVSSSPAVGGRIVTGLRLQCASGTPRPPFNGTAPTLLSPNLGSADKDRVVGAKQRFTFRRVGNDASYNAQYQVCVRSDNSGHCMLEQLLSPGSSGQFELSIPSVAEGRTLNWRARTCSAEVSSQLYCGHYSQPTPFFVIPRAATPAQPMANARQSTRTVVFRWRDRASANAGYQLVIWKSGARADYVYDNPKANPHSIGKSINVFVQPGTTSQRVDVPGDLGNSVEWAVYACALDDNNRRVCARSLRSGRGLKLSGSSQQAPAKNIRQTPSSTKKITKGMIGVKK